MDLILYCFRECPIQLCPRKRLQVPKNGLIHAALAAPAFFQVDSYSELSWRIAPVSRLAVPPVSFH
ncbi:hypothetical protein [Pseudomonas lundensis]|uniref:hypothetical protein n=1 Tax=Pseudomonas lundensis TaxID=86185 RepID=UPI0021CCE393|nr:hypothetical protein [Pseudomonas lundensis]